MESKDKGLEEAQVIESNAVKKAGDMAEKVLDSVKEVVSDSIDNTNAEMAQSDSAFDRGMAEMFEKMDAPKGDLDKADKMADNQDSVKGSEQEQSR